MRRFQFMRSFGLQVVYGSVDHDLGHFHQMHDRQRHIALGAGHAVAEFTGAGGGAAQQIAGMHQGVFMTDIWVGGEEGRIGDDFSM